MTESVLESLETTPSHKATKKRLSALGLTICLEWAQDNKRRKIDSAAIAVWGNALRTAVEREQQIHFLNQIESDVAALLAGKLRRQEIVRERYYPAEDYDNF